MRKAKVLEINKYEDYQRTKKKNRIVLKVEYNNEKFFLDVTDELKECGIDYEYDIEKLKSALPDYVYASFFEISFRISKSSMEKWMNNLKIN